MIKLNGIYVLIRYNTIYSWAFRLYIIIIYFLNINNKQQQLYNIFLIEFLNWFWFLFLFILFN